MPISFYLSVAKMTGVKDTKTIVKFLDTIFLRTRNTCKAIEPYYKITK